MTKQRSTATYRVGGNGPNGWQVYEKRTGVVVAEFESLSDASADCQSRNITAREESAK